MLQLIITKCVTDMRTSLPKGNRNIKCTNCTILVIPLKALNSMQSVRNCPLLIVTGAKWCHTQRLCGWSFKHRITRGIDANAAAVAVLLPDAIRLFCPQTPSSAACWPLNKTRPHINSLPLISCYRYYKKNAICRNKSRINWDQRRLFNAHPTPPPKKSKITGRNERRSADLAKLCNAE